MESHTKSEFARLARHLRVTAGLKQREVAALIGVQPGTYGNLESSPFKVVREEKAQKMCEIYKLNQDDAKTLMAAWQACPLSAYAEKTRLRWKLQNARRNKARNHDRMALALCEVIAILFLHVPDEQTICTCGFDGKSAGDPTRACELCEALEALGLPAFTTRDAANAGLLNIQRKLEEALGIKS